MVRIVTDSTASIPPELCRDLQITVVPIPIQFGNETFIDGVEPVALYYDQLRTAPSPPTTSTPSPGTFLETFRQVAAEAEEIITIHVMESKSTLVNTARIAAAMLPEVPIHVVDSQSTTMGLGLMAILAARAAQAGQQAEVILAMLRRLIPETSCFAAIPQLTQLRKSGRVSLTQALLGGMLSIKPILYIGQSMVDVVDKVRGWSGAVESMVEMARAKAGEAKVILAVVHTDAEAEARELMERIKSRFHAVETLVAEAGPTLAAHAGPGALGIITMVVE